MSGLMLRPGAVEFVDLSALSAVGEEIECGDDEVAEAGDLLTSLLVTAVAGADALGDARRGELFGLVQAPAIT